MGTTYIQISQLDYDDYPIGSGRMIGPFDDVDAAVEWLGSSGLFYNEEYGWAKDGKTARLYGWKRKGMNTRHSIRIADLLDAYMTNPEEYVKMYKAGDN